MKTLLKLSAGTAIGLAFASTAQAGCGNAMYSGSSHSGTSTLPPLSSYYGGSSAGAHTSYGSYSSGSSYIMSDSEASMRYGSGSVSRTYVGGGVEMAASPAMGSYSSSSTYSYTGSGVEYGGDTQLLSFSGSTVPGLGAGESLQPTSCPVSVHNPGGAKVLGCYSVVKKVVQPVVNTTYYRVVRPVIYVRYPVPVPVPYTVYSQCATHVNWSRYGGYGPQGGYGFYGGCR